MDTVHVHAATPNDSSAIKVSNCTIIRIVTVVLLTSLTARGCVL